jgi:hypothetical protein
MGKSVNKTVEIGVVWLDNGALVRRSVISFFLLMTEME